MKQRILLWTGVTLLGLLVLASVNPILGQLLYRLPWGWIGFLRRTLPEVTINWGGVGWVLLVSGIVLAGLHWLCGWLYARVRAGGGDTAPARHWPWRWTLATYAGFWLLFSVVMSAAGLVRHVGWLLDFKAPLYVERAQPHAELRLAAFQIEMALQEGDGRLAQTRAAFFAADDPKSARRPSVWERHHTLFFTGRDKNLTAVVVFPRDLKAFAQAGLAVIRNGETAEFQSWTNLSAILSRLESQKKD